MRKLGFAVPESQGLVRVNGKLAIRLEHVTGDCVEYRLWAEPGSGSDIGTKIGQLHVSLHTMQAADALMAKPERCPTAEFLVSQSLRKLRGHPDIGTLERLLSNYCGNDVPCHGDFHPSNILDSHSRLVVLDWCDSFLGRHESDIGITIVRIRSVEPDPEAQPDAVSRFRKNLELLEAAYLAAYDVGRKLNRPAVEAWVRLAAVLTRVRKRGYAGVIDKLIAGEFSLRW